MKPRVILSVPNFFFLIYFITIIPSVWAVKSDFQPLFKPTMNVPRIEETIKIDGILDDAGWLKATKENRFTEVSPGDQVEPPVESEVWIAYNETYLYVALIAYDNPDEIRVSMRERDEIYRDDYFGIMLDTYGDANWGYELFVNPLGIQMDLRMAYDGNEDMTFDIVWESEGKVTENGYQVEIAIPFSSLRFPDKKEQTWKANFWRDHQREVRRRYAWSARDLDDPCFICQWGTLTGIKDIKPGQNLEIMPNVIGYQSGSIKDAGDPNSGFNNEDIDGEASINVRYGLTSNSSLEVAYNPDFSQIESDADQLDVNTTFALYYDEGRPFFQEGSDLFSTWIDGVYTRSINDPEVAAKFTGQFNRFSVAYIFARDENTPILIPLSQRSVDGLTGKSTVNIVRAKRTFWEDSYIGLMATNRLINGDGSGSIAGLDGSIRFWKNYGFEFQTLASYTDEFDAPDLIDTTMKDGIGQVHFDGDQHTVAFDDENYWGHAVYASVEREGRTWNMDLGYVEFSPTFRTDNGFTTRNDYRNLDFWTGWYFRPNREWLVAWQPSIDIGRIWDHDTPPNPFRFEDGARDEWIRFGLYFLSKGQTEIYFSYLNSRERFSGYFFEGISNFEIEVDSRFSEMLSGGVCFNYGKTIYRQHYREYDEISDEGDTTHVVKEPDMGTGTGVYTYLNFKPTQRLFIQPVFNYAKMNHSDRYLEGHPDEDKEIYSGYILRTRFSYQFSREWDLRLVVQYNDFRNTLDIEPLLTYRLNPFTKFYVGATGNYKYYDTADYDFLDKSEWEITSRQFFCKFQYLFRI